MLNASQMRTKREAFSEESMSRTPASTAGWLPTMPTTRPFMRAYPHVIDMAQCRCTSKYSPSSTTALMIFFMS